MLKPSRIKNHTFCSRNIPWFNSKNKSLKFCKFTNLVTRVSWKDKLKIAKKFFIRAFWKPEGTRDSIPYKSEYTVPAESRYEILPSR